MYNIGVVGEISTGKSAVVNALLGQVVARSSLGRETLTTSCYTPDTPKPYRVFDFPGLNDTMDFTQEYRALSRCNVVLFVTNIERPLITQSEQTLLRNISTALGKYTHKPELILVVNKYDCLTDQELADLYKNIRLPNGVAMELPRYRFSAHIAIYCSLVTGENIPDWYANEWMKIQRKMVLYQDEVASGGDYDGLLTYLKTYDGWKLKAMYQKLQKLLQRYKNPEADQDVLQRRAKQIADLCSAAVASVKTTNSAARVCAVILDIVSEFVQVGYYNNNRKHDTGIPREGQPPAHLWITGGFRRVGEPENHTFRIYPHAYRPEWILLRELCTVGEVLYNTYKTELPWPDIIWLHSVTDYANLRWLHSVGYPHYLQAFSFTDDPATATYIQGCYQRLLAQASGNPTAALAAYLMDYPATKLYMLQHQEMQVAIASRLNMLKYSVLWRYLHDFKNRNQYHCREMHSIDRDVIKPYYTSDILHLITSTQTDKDLILQLTPYATPETPTACIVDTIDTDSDTDNEC